MRERLHDHDRGQRAERLAPAQRDRDAVDRRGHEPALGVLARQRLEHAEHRDGDRHREVDLLGAAHSHDARKVPARGARFIGLADDRSVRRAGDAQSPGRATTGDENRP